jgi:tetratricopeptide (TPR) repeat protein
MNKGLLAALVAVALVAVIFFSDELRRVGWAVQYAVKARQEPAQAPRARATPPVKPAEFKGSAEPELQNKVRDLLYAAKYAELEQLLEKLRQDTARDPGNEYQLLHAFGAFEDTESRMREEIDAWIEQHPDSAAARIARGGQRTEAAWERRGTKSSAEVADDAMADFSRVLELAKKDAELALARVPDHPVAWRLLIRASGGTQGAGALEALIPRVQQQAPASYLAHRNVLMFLQPRWGGSYAAMEAYAEAAQAARDKNPRLEVLRGYPYWAAGYTAQVAKDHDQAIALYDRALRFGEDPVFLSDRANALMRALRFKESLADLARVHERFPTRESKKQLDEAQSKMRNSAYALHRAKDDAQALKAYTAFLEVWPDDEDALFYSATVSSRLNHYGEALRGYKRVLALNPEHFEAVKGADQVLAYEKRWPEILALWEDYLGRVPDNGQAYFERGGTYFQMHDIPNAYKNAAKACELKVDAACAWKQRLASHPSVKG